MSHDVTHCDSDGFYLTHGEHKVKLSGTNEQMQKQIHDNNVSNNIPIEVVAVNDYEGKTHYISKMDYQNGYLWNKGTQYRLFNKQGLAIRPKMDRHGRYLGNNTTIHKDNIV